MLIALNFGSDVPIYLQIRNQIVLGIAEGRLQAGERLPSIRTLSEEAGVNMMTVNKAYQLLKQEGYITIDRRSGTRVGGTGSDRSAALNRLKEELRLSFSEARLNGVSQEELLALCKRVCMELEECECSPSTS